MSRSLNKPASAAALRGRQQHVQERIADDDAIRGNSRIGELTIDELRTKLAAVIARRDLLLTWRQTRKVAGELGALRARIMKINSRLAAMGDGATVPAVLAAPLPMKPPGRRGEP